VASASAGLWADLKALEAPPPELNQVEELLKEGASSLTVEGMQGLSKPAVSPATWKRLPEPQVLRGLPRVASAPLPVLLPRLDFVLEHQGTKVKEAWIGGKRFSEGSSPDGVHRIKRITGRTVLLEGPTGETFLTTDLGINASPPKVKTTAASAETK
jgi:hypothetical protein